MRWPWFLLLLGCAKAEDPALDVVRLPVTAYGPFDAAIALVANDAGRSDPKLKNPHVAVQCFAIEEVDEEEDVAPAPFDDCPKERDGQKFEPRATSERRARNRDICCYVAKERVIRIDEVE